MKDIIIRQAVYNDIFKIKGILKEVLDRPGKMKLCDSFYDENGEFL